MKLRDNQTFLSLYYEPNAVEIATGGADSFAAVASWQRETKQLGQVGTPEPVAALMARWVMPAKLVESRSAKFASGAEFEITQPCRLAIHVLKSSRAAWRRFRDAS